LPAAVQPAPVKKLVESEPIEFTTLAEAGDPQQIETWSHPTLTR